ncbi:ATP-grasp domain-containing protein [Virgibacillus ihumii]|uniref:ATP-grasp domain-containing protein n=1 Tax=Virgibacillus ihumii TaxID=2686091 RepID=UPI00157D0777|nr:RimK family alpha-L-glutamate ligase [Virgibacillus ihumii]
MNPKGWIIYNGYLPGNKFLDFAEWIQAAALHRNVQTKIIKNNQLLTYLTNNSLDIIRDSTITLPDFVIFTDKDIYLARQLELMGVRVFNNSRTIEISDDKIASYQTIAAHKLPIPKTIVSPKMFAPSVAFDPGDYQEAINELGFPMVIKEAFGSFGEQVYLVHNKQEMHTKLSELQGKPFVLQEFVSTSYGRDIRLHVTGEKVVAAMTRHAQNDFRANVTAGGKMQTHQPTTDEKNLAIAAAQAIGADFAGVDLLFGPNESPLICEINSNAHIRNIYDCTGVNVAESMIDHVLACIESGGSL